MILTSAITFEQFKSMCMSVMSVNCDQKEVNENLIREFAEKSFTVEHIKSLFSENLNEQQMLIYIEVIVKNVVTNSNCKMAQRTRMNPVNMDSKHD